MQTDNELKRIFHRRAAAVMPPASLDERVAGLFERHIGTQPAKTRRRARSAFGRRTATIALALLLFGSLAYASTTVYRMSTENFRYSMTADPTIALKHASGKQIYEAVAFVQGKLGEDEKAVTFIRLLDEEKLPPLISVSKPRLYTDIAEWKKAVKFDAAWKMPQRLPEGYKIAGGRTQFPIEAVTAEWADRYGSKLKKEAQKSEDAVSWIIIGKGGHPPYPGIDIPNLVIKTKAGGEIIVSWMSVPPDTKVAMDVKTGGMTVAEKLDVNGVDAVYSYNADHFFSPTGRMQSLSWSEQKNGTTILYQLSADAPDMTKNDLVAIARNME
ncbi:hypothetical protein [Paenibacillus sp. GYB003]|uniref:hypothetical protein n=1 Tax=Paenibacillus sp. GYB003 TaxID=2994392 RepID=UPI002F962881